MKNSYLHNKMKFFLPCITSELNKWYEHVVLRVL